MTRTLKATKSQAKPTLGEFTETEAGVYQSVFTTGTQSGEATITVSVDGMSKTATAELRATMMDVAFMPVAREIKLPVVPVAYSTCCSSNG